MATHCDICDRGSAKGATRSHSNIRTIRRQNINLHPKRVDGKRLMVCTKCLKTMVKMK